MIAAAFLKGNWTPTDADGATKKDRVENTSLRWEKEVCALWEKVEPHRHEGRA